jgi:hypothetical protein
MVHEDQKLPSKDSKNKKQDEIQGSNSFYYVNKNGFAVQSQIAISPPPPPKNTTLVTTKNEKQTKSLNKSKKNSNKTTSNNNPLICTDLLVEMCKNDKPNTKDYQKLDCESTTDSITTSSSIGDHQSDTRSVPGKLNSSCSSNDVPTSNSLVQRDANGKCLINTNLTVQEPTIDINNDHVKFVNLFSILCCWCFPITGIISIIFARSTRKFYDMRDMAKAKKYLVRSEWMLIITIFFGCTIIGLAFGLLESFIFKNDGEVLQKGVYHRKSFN